MNGPEKHNNPGFVTNIQFAKVELALFGKDGRSGIVKDIGDIKHQTKSICDWRIQHDEEEEANKRDWVGAAKTIATGTIIALFTWIIANYRP